MDGAALQSLGVDNGITTGPYEPCGVWADALFTHPDRPDGIIYPSRHDPDQACVALFRRADLAIEVASESVPLLEMLPEVASVLRRYGKGIAETREERRPAIQCQPFFCETWLPAFAGMSGISCHVFPAGLNKF